jgi:hypothetical protein
MNRNHHRPPGPNTPRAGRLSNASLAWWPGLAGIGFGSAMLAGAAGQLTGFIAVFLAGSSCLTAVGAMVWASARTRPQGVTSPAPAGAPVDVDDDLDVDESDMDDAVASGVTA